MNRCNGFRKDFNLWDEASVYVSVSVIPQSLFGFYSANNCAKETCAQFINESRSRRAGPLKQEVGLKAARASWSSIHEGLAEHRPVSRPTMGQDVFVPTFRSREESRYR
ncbi:hypothetical protein L596_005250 [Steinernema carpocapsae]|uniref:Uncharacterized protein n=1 Tax=Steinernema carpocapsae TaxID=34508 RepID=A0A4U8UYN6_STECR|nr:hypothetical protein L596_005250 [Steinernema carpocapsae]